MRSVPMNFLLVSLLSICSVDAFTPQHRAPAHSSSSTSLQAGGEAPQYEKIEATLRQAEKVARGSYVLQIETEDGLDYEPGHVIALEIESDLSTDQDVDSKTYQDARGNGGWMRGPYTVSRCTNDSLDIMIKAVGEKSKRFAGAKSGMPLRLGGKFHVPILEGIDGDSTKRVVFISTGVGVGPCVGAIEKALNDASFPPIDLIASYRTSEEIVYREHLDKLQGENPRSFSWKVIVTSEQGRLSASKDNLNALTDSKFISGLEDTHYHLIGNGQMVSEFKAGLKKAGVPKEKITIETYFNHKAQKDSEAADRVATAVMESAPASIV